MESAASLSARCIAGRRARPCRRARPAAAQAGGAPRREAQPPRPVRRVVALASEGDAVRASADAYNRAMQAYSQSPFTYQHEAGLCARPPTVTRLFTRAPPRARAAPPLARDRRRTDVLGKPHRAPRADYHEVDANLFVGALQSTRLAPAAAAARALTPPPAPRLQGRNPKRLRTSTGCGTRRA